MVTAPAHIVHGSSVTTRVRPSSRQPPTARAAALMATTLGVRRGVTVGLAPVSPAGDDGPGAVEDDRAYRHVPGRGRGVRLGQRGPHGGLERRLVPGDQFARHGGEARQAPSAMSSARSMAGPNPSRTAMDSTASST